MTARLLQGRQGQVYRERLALDHAQRLFGNITDLTLNSNIAGMDNRLVTTVAASSQQFNFVAGALLFTSDHGHPGQSGSRPLWPAHDENI